MQINILIVDDVEANLISLEALLEGIDDFNIIKASGGEEALDIVLSQKINLIILDIQMPIMDGFEVAKLLKSNKLTKEIPVIFLTAAFKSDEFIQKGFSLGAVDYLTKPIDENQFINRISLYVKLIKSVEQNRQKDKALYEATKMASMGEMIGNIAHQWRQPLSIISTCATSSILHKQLDLLSDDRFDKNMNIINDNVQYLSKTIDDFRGFIKGERESEDFRIQDSINSFINLVQGSIKNHYINVIKDIPDDLEIKDGYYNELVQCYLNIYNNSKDALKLIEDEDDRYLFIDAYKQNDKIIIKFTDSAGGVNKDIIDKIFEPYFTTKHQKQGTGLGLSMTYNLITKGMEGTIEATNKEFIQDNKNYKGLEIKITL